MVAAMAAAAYGGQVGIRITKTAKAPVIDGKLTDACWAKQAPLTDFTRNDVESTPGRLSGQSALGSKNVAPSHSSLTGAIPSTHQEAIPVRLELALLRRGVAARTLRDKGTHVAEEVGAGDATS